MQTAIEAIKETGRRIGRSVTLKLITIAILILLLLIPSAMVNNLIWEREYRKDDVVREISDKWGGPQVVTGPVITVPYHKHKEGEKGKIITWTEYFHILPDTVDIQSDITPNVRYRGIYEAVLYHTDLTLKGTFSGVPVKDLRIPPEDIQWAGAYISLGVSDMRGITDRIGASFGGKELSMEPGLETADVIESGVSSGIPLDGSNTERTFHFTVSLNGSSYLRFVPVGKTTTVFARSEWKDPSFDGAFLPVSRNITDSGFSARWKVLHLNRNYPQHWKGKGQEIMPSMFGMSLFSPVDVYQKTTRTAKYALMFIVFTFTAFFIAEVMNRLRVHPVQYLFIGLGIIVFYTLLLSISEHAGFGAAYLISATGVIGLITGYAKAILKNRLVTLMVGGILAVLYAYLYIVLQLEDYALLMGSVGLFLVLAAVMYFTRKIDWYGATGQPEASPAAGASAS
jgi:inner membrane protein